MAVLKWLVTCVGNMEHVQTELVWLLADCINTVCRFVIYKPIPIFYSLPTHGMDNHHNQNDFNFSHNYGVLQAKTHHVTTKELFRRLNPSRFQDFEDWINDLNVMVSPWFTSKEQYLLSHILDSTWTDTLWLLQISKSQHPTMSCLRQHQPTFYPCNYAICLLNLPR